MDYERVQVLLRPRERAAIRNEAERLGVSMSEVIRRAIEPLVIDEPDEEDPFFGIIGLDDSLDGPTDVSVNVKHYLYGFPKKAPLGRPS